MTITTMRELASLIGQTFPNATTIPVVIIPWGELPEGLTAAGPGLMVGYEDDVFRIGVYGDLDYEALVMIDIDTADRAWAVLEHLTENQPDGTDWAAWATHWCESIWPDVQHDFT